MVPLRRKRQISNVMMKIPRTLLLLVVLAAAVTVTADTYQNFNYAIFIQISDSKNSPSNVPSAPAPPPSSPPGSALPTPSNLIPPTSGGMASPEPAVCPANTLSCQSIGAPEYCCSKADYCAHDSMNRIGCCPWGD